MAGELIINSLSPQAVLDHLERIRRERELAQTFIKWNKSKEPQERAELWQEMFRMARELEAGNVKVHDCVRHNDLPMGQGNGC